MTSTGLVIGAWVDDGFSTINADYVKRFQDAGLSEAALMVNKMNAHRSAPGWELRSDAKLIIRAADQFQRAGVKVILTCWPRPDRAQLAALEEGMRPLVAAIDPVAIEVDTEANWLPPMRKGFRNMSEAANELVAVLRRLAGPTRYLELTTYPFHTENGPEALVAPHMDLLLPQAYSVCERAGKPVAWDSEYGPGRMQEITFRRTAQTGAPQKALAACGLAAYEQRFAGHQPEEAMQVALDTVKSFGVDRVRYWSSKWIVGALAKKQPWAARATRAAALAG